MKSQTINRLMIAGVVSAIALSLIPTRQVNAEGEGISFICKTNNKVPVTYAYYQGQKHALIRWIKTLGNRTPQERCEQISPRFQEAYDNGSLNIIANGIMNRQPVICTVRQYGGDCVTLLMTLRPTDNSFIVLNELKGALSGRSIGPMRHSSGTPQMYYQIDLEQALKNAPVEPE